MIKSQKLSVVTLCCALLSGQSYAVAPVVDKSDSYSMQTDQKESEIPMILAQKDDTIFDNEEPFIFDEERTSSPKPKATVKDNAKILEQIQAMQQEIQELRGQIEVQSHDLKMLQQQQVAFYKDLDARLQNKLTEEEPGTDISDLESSKSIKDEQSADLNKETQLRPSKKATIKHSSKKRGNPADEQISYLAAYDLVKTKQYDDAIKAMQSFINQYPEGGYAANAEYWLGELYLVKKQYNQAIEHFDTVLDKFPTSSKSAPSLLKMGYAMAASGKIEQARQILKQVIKNYPDTATSKLAYNRLETLGRI